MTDKKIEAQIYRFKLSPHIVDLIADFSKIHEYDHRTDYKKAWEEWYNNNDEVKREEERLKSLNYEGDINQKMYKAGRYYFRKKQTKEKKDEPQKRNTYISMDSAILEQMDRHIINNINEDWYYPAEGYEHFCKINKDDIAIEVKRLLSNNDNLNDESIKNKIKKTYKNRYYLISRN